ncbi:MAG: cell division protein ZipA C-terminal FtsZ-binding domain-containing protein [Gammaproteobacteria bacterium]
MSTKPFASPRVDAVEGLLQTLTNDLRLALLLVGGLLLLVILLWEVVQRRRAARADSTHLRGPLGQARSAPNEDLAESDPLLEPVRRSADHAPSLSSQERVEPTLTLPEIHVRDRLVEPPLVDFDRAMSAKDLGNSIPVMESESAPDPTPGRVAVAVGADEVGEIAHETEHPAQHDTRSENAEPVIVALRVVAREGERFTGAALRQALQGEGFVHGDMNIFHRSLVDGRVLMSAASLTKPGNFDLGTMDALRFLGLNLFVVLPGPVPGREAVDKLLTVGHTLAQRLRGNLLDSRGQSLTEARLAEMRREAAAAGGR